MKLKFCPFPYLLSFSDNLPEGVGGRATMFFVRIRPKYKDDEGIIKHECFHIMMYWLITLPLLILVGVGGFFNEIVWAAAFLVPSFEPIFYQFFSLYQKWVEIRAYRRQLKYPPANSNKEGYITMYYAPALVSKYGFKMTMEGAIKKLS